MATVRLTYAQLAARLGRSTDATPMLVRRRHWQVVKGNDGRSVVLVDKSELDEPRAPERASEQSEQRSDAVLLERALKAEAEAAAKDAIIAELQAAVAWHRLPFWRRWWG